MRDHLLAVDLLITSSFEADTCILPDPADLALRSGTPVLRLSCKPKYLRRLLRHSFVSTPKNISHAAINMAAVAGPMTKPFIPKASIPPRIEKNNI